MLVETGRVHVSRGELSRHSDESQNLLNDEIAGQARSDGLLQQPNLTGFKNLLGLQVQHRVTKARLPERQCEFDCHA
jgi:hypothetical protein